VEGNYPETPPLPLQEWPLKAHITFNEYFGVICRPLCEGKVEMSQCLTKHHAMKTYGGVEVQLHEFNPDTRWR
jgi:hypothetical protein